MTLLQYKYNFFIYHFSCKFSKKDKQAQINNSRFNTESIKMLRNKAERPRSLESVLSDLDYIDMSGAQLLKNTSVMTSKRNSTFDMDTYSPGNFMEWDTSRKSCRNMDTNTDIISHDDTYVSVNGSILEHCTHKRTDIKSQYSNIESINCSNMCIDDAFICGHSEEEDTEDDDEYDSKDSTYMSIGSVCNFTPLRIPPKLPKRNGESSPPKNNVKTSNNQGNFVSDKIDSHSYTLEQIFNSVDSLTGDLHDSLNSDIDTADDATNGDIYYNSGSSNDSAFYEDIKPKHGKSDKLCDYYMNVSDKALKNKSENTQKTINLRNRKYPYLRQQKKTAHNRHEKAVSNIYDIKPYIHTCLAKENDCNKHTPFISKSSTLERSSINSEMFPKSMTNNITNTIKSTPSKGSVLKGKKRKLSFLNHLGSVSSILSSHKTRPRLYSASEYSIQMAKDSLQKNSISIMRGLKKDRLSLIQSNRALYGETGMIHHGFINPMSRETCF